MDSKIQLGVTPMERATFVAGLQMSVNVLGQQKLPIALVAQLGEREALTQSIRLLAELEPAAMIPAVQQQAELPLATAVELPRNETGKVEGGTILLCTDENLLADIRRFCADLELLAEERDRSDKTADRVEDLFDELWECACVVIRRAKDGLRPHDPFVKTGKAEVQEDATPEPATLDELPLADRSAASEADQRAAVLQAAALRFG